MVVYTRSTRGKALLVEDEFLVSLQISELLEEIGFVVVGPASRVSQAIQIAQSENDLSVALLDVNLAGEKSWPVARLLREKGIPFVFVSGYDKEHAEIPADLEGTALLPKPLDPFRFADAILELCECG